jgi:hypothetical protein
MKLPAFLYGRYAEVNPRCRKLVAAFAKGARWDDLAGDMVETRNAAGLIVLEGPSKTFDDADHFQCFVPARAVHDAVMNDRLPDTIYRDVAQQWMASAWGVLALLGQDGRGFPGPDQYIAFLRAFLRCWNEFAAEGKRYSYGTHDARELWTMPTSIGYVLGQMGIPLQTLRARQSADDLLALIRQALEESHG